MIKNRFLSSNIFSSSTKLFTQSHHNFNTEVLTKVDEVHDSVDPGLPKDDPADQLVKVYVVVQGQDGGQAEVPR